MSNGLTNSNQSGSNAKIQSFLESLRASRSEGPKNPFKEIQVKKEIEQSRIEQFHQARQQEWNSIYSAKEKAKDQKIEQIRLQLKKLAENLKTLQVNVTKAVDTPIFNSGAYDESFFTHLQKVIKLYSQSVNNTNLWLQQYTSRVNKKNYANMSKTGGSSYTQNNERVIATSVG